MARDRQYDLTPTTDQAGFIAILERSLANNPGNVAVRAHLADVRVMDEAQFLAHRADLFAREDDFKEVIRAMANEVIRKTHRRR